MLAGIVVIIFGGMCGSRGGHGGGGCGGGGMHLSCGIINLPLLEMVCMEDDIDNVIIAGQCYKF